MGIAKYESPYQLGEFTPAEIMQEFHIRNLASMDGLSKARLNPAGISLNHVCRAPLSDQHIRAAHVDELWHSILLDRENSPRLRR